MIPSFTDEPIQQSYLSQLSDHESEFAVSFLKDIFLHEKSNIATVAEDQIQTVISLCCAFTSNPVKAKVLAALHPELQFKVIWGLPEPEQVALFTYLDDTALLQSLFQELAQDRQNKILSTLHDSDRHRYSQLKTLSKTAVSMVGGILVSGQKSVAQVMADDIKDLIGKIKDPSLSSDHMTKLGNRYIPKYESQDLDRLSSGLLKSFINLKLPLKNKDSFLIYLKFFHFFSAIFPLFAQTLRTQFAPLLHRVIMGLSKLPDTAWLMRVLNQFPVFAIMIILEQLMNYESLASFEKRNLYCKLYNDIHKHLKMKGADQIRIAFTKI